ncbi:MAG: alpha/beta hydrolase [Proteobacteria bacterium]|jgi:pimeloyl-ACP methyl ester carboxylesterase|nr:alpha/beta hydrolase [Pseudomonadota bacterium]
MTIRRTLSPTGYVLSALAVFLIALTASSCNVVRWRGNRIERGLERTGFERRVEELGAAKIAFWDGGEGPAIVLLHGFGADAMWQWNPQAEAFATKHRVVIPDLLWFGGSKPADADYSLTHQVDVVLALMDRLDIATADFVGSSYGGLVEYELARTHPERVRRLVISDSPGSIYTRADYDALCARFGVAELGDLLVPTDADGVRRLLEIGYYDPPWLPRFALESAYKEMYSEHRAERRALLTWLVENMGALGAKPEKPTMPTLLVWGDGDEVFPIAIAERLAAHLGPETKTLIIEKARHSPNLEYPDEFNAAVLDFLAQGEPRV